MLVQKRAKPGARLGLLAAGLSLGAVVAVGLVNADAGRARRDVSPAIPAAAPRAAPADDSTSAGSVPNVRDLSSAPTSAPDFGPVEPTPGAVGDSTPASAIPRAPSEDRKHSPPLLDPVAGPEPSWKTPADPDSKRPGDTGVNIKKVPGSR